MKPPRLVLLGTALLAAALSAHAGEISAQQLRALLAQPGPHPVLIDIRKTDDYTQGSIPGAINIPARVLLEKRLNLSRGCILISDGINDKIDPAQLASELAATGVDNVNYLHGGLAAWSELDKAPTTTGTGATIGRTNSVVTYQDLAKREGDVCIVDLRSEEERAVPEGHQCPVNGFCLTQHFDYLPTLQDFYKLHAGTDRASRAGQGPLIVLIPGKDNDGEHEVKKLHVEGHRRVAVLIGGAEIIAVEGRRGLKRGSGTVIEVDGNRFTPAPTEAPQEIPAEPEPAEQP